jgi:hypothetical protein
MSIRATVSSIESPTRVGITQLNATMALPTSRMESECPSPQAKPIRAAARVV